MCRSCCCRCHLFFVDVDVDAGVVLVLVVVFIVTFYVLQGQKKLGFGVQNQMLVNSERFSRNSEDSSDCWSLGFFSRVEGLWLQICHPRNLLNPVIQMSWTVLGGLVEAMGVRCSHSARSRCVSHCQKMPSWTPTNYGGTKLV